MNVEEIAHNLFSHQSSRMTILCGALILAICILFIEYKRTKAAYLKLLHQKKSSEVRTGKVAEILAPFVDSFPVDVKKPGTSTVFMGQPIDYIHFDPEEGITFIEIKSGNSELSVDQRRHKKNIEAGNVFWEQVKIKE